MAFLDLSGIFLKAIFGLYGGGKINKIEKQTYIGANKEL